MDITLIGVTKRFKNVEALTRVSLNIKDGAVHVVGAVHMRQDHPPAHCEFYIPDEARSCSAAARFRTSAIKRAGMMFQNYALWPHMTCRSIYGLVQNVLSQTGRRSPKTPLPRLD